MQIYNGFANFATQNYGKGLSDRKMSYSYQLIVVIGYELVICCYILLCVA